MPVGEIPKQPDIRVHYGCLWAVVQLVLIAMLLACVVVMILSEPVL